MYVRSCLAFALVYVLIEVTIGPISYQGNAMDPLGYSYAVNSSSSSPLRGQISKALTSSKDTFCDSESCERFSRTFLKHLNHGINACDNFYQFVCHNIDETVDAFGYIGVKNKIKHLATNKPNQEGVEESRNLVRLRNFYSSCKTESWYFPTKQTKLYRQVTYETNYLVLDPKNLQYLTGLIRQLGGFPLASESSGWNNQAKFDWVQTTIKFRDLGLDLNQFFEFSCKPDYTDFLMTMSMTEQKFNIDKMTIENLVKDLYPDQEIDSIRGQLDDLIEFRSQMIQVDTGFSNEEDGYLCRLSHLETIMPQIDWTMLFGNLIGGDKDLGDMSLFIKNRKKTPAIAMLIGWARPEVLANHMIVSVIEKFAPYVTIESGGSRRQLSNGYPKPDCVEALQQNLELAISIEFYKKFVTPRTVHATANLVSAIKDEIKLMIDEQDWIVRRETKSMAKAKLDTMKFDYGIASCLLYDDTSEWLYRGLKLDSSRPIQNIMKINRAKHEVYLKDLMNKKREHYDWIQYDSRNMGQPNAAYDQPSHRIYISSEIMDQIYIDDSRLSSINFGVLGTTIAHEFMHTFDLQSISRDSSNRERNWCDPGSRTNYNAKVDCLSKQYSGLKPIGAKWLVDGATTLLENMADNAGFEVAYRAFKRWMRTHKEAHLLRGIDLDAKQLFWASYAARSCARFKSTQHFDVLQSCRHSPPEFRVNIPLSNYKSFSDDFDCSSNSPMNPVNKCIIWT